MGNLRSQLLLRAECALSPREAGERAARLFEIAPNSNEQGRKNQMAAWHRNWSERAQRLVWC